jgi:hypothetical protein
MEQLQLLVIERLKRHLMVGWRGLLRRGRGLVVMVAGSGVMLPGVGTEGKLNDR